MDNIFAKRLKELREEKNVSALQLSKELRVSASTILRWEKGQRLPNIDALILLAKYFKVSTDYLCGLEE